MSEQKRHRSQCLVIRDNKILMATHSVDGEKWLCLPGGGVEENETPDEAAIRELYEECLVKGKILKKTSEYADPFAGSLTYTFLVDIGDQCPKLGEDPEELENPILIHIGWYALYEICERDRAYLWAAGLISSLYFANELSTWSDDISYPTAS